jgi:hypothetical protein
LNEAVKAVKCKEWKKKLLFVGREAAVGREVVVRMIFVVTTIHRSYILPQPLSIITDFGPCVRRKWTTVVMFDTATCAVIVQRAAMGRGTVTFPAQSGAFGAEQTFLRRRTFCLEDAVDDSCAKVRRGRKNVGKM